MRRGIWLAVRRRLGGILNMAFTSQENIHAQGIHEGALTRKIEEQTGKVPSLGYLGLAFGSMAVSALLAFGARRKEFANFVGLWAPSILIMGVYNKLVKLEHEMNGLRGDSTIGSYSPDQNTTSSSFHGLP